MLEGTTFGSGGFQVNYPGLKSGSLTVTMLANYAASANMETLNTLFGGYAAL